jgi:3-oxoacyl-[acyl-carrier-protein] synthase II
MSTEPGSPDVVVTGMGLVCPAASAVRDLAATGADRAAPSSASQGDAWFDAPRFLGPRGYKYLTPATRYMVAASGAAMSEAGVAGDTYPADRKGVMVGSNFAVAGVHAAMDRTILADGASALSPNYAANFSINLAASHVSLKYGCKGFNVCFTSTMVAGVEALLFGVRAIGRRRADFVVAGATEDAPPAEVAEVIGCRVQDGGACALALERGDAAMRRGATIYGRFPTGTLAFFDPARLQASDGAAGLESVIAHAVAQLGLDGPASLHRYALTCRYAFNDAVNEAVRQALARRGVDLIEASGAGADGSLFTVSPVLLAALAAYRRQNALLVTTSPRGHIALLVFQSAAVTG